MAWQVELSDGALRELNKMEKKDSERIIKKLEQATTNPQHFFERLTGYDDCKLRTGDYCTVVKLVREKQLIFVKSIGHRKNVYDKL